jgi:hypothetical protein
MRKIGLLAVMVSVLLGGVAVVERDGRLSTPVEY